jgi:hypothetical protein
MQVPTVDIPHLVKRHKEAMGGVATPRVEGLPNVSGDREAVDGEHSGGQADAEEDEDSRTLWVDYDAHGARYKSWRSACQESFQEKHVGCSKPGSMDCLHLCKTIGKNGNTQIIWLDKFCGARGITEYDRNYKELIVLATVLQEAGEFDQVNLGGLVCLETVARRFQTMTEALKRGA